MKRVLANKKAIALFVVPGFVYNTGYRTGYLVTVLFFVQWKSGITVGICRV